MAQVVTRPFQEFLEQYSDSLAELGTARADVLYDPQQPNADAQRILALCRKRVQASTKFREVEQQLHRVVANVLGFQEWQYPGIIDALAPRCGKTPTGLLTADVLSQLNPRFVKRVLVVCPPHLVPQWLDDIQAMFGSYAQAYNLNESVSAESVKKKRQTLGQRYRRTMMESAAQQKAQADTLAWQYAKSGFYRLTQLRRKPNPAKLEFYVVGLVKFREAPPWRPIEILCHDMTWYQQRVKEMVVRDNVCTEITEASLAWLDLEPTDKRRQAIQEGLAARLNRRMCPDCGRELLDKNGFPVLMGNSSKARCPKCQAALFQPCQGKLDGNMAEYIARFLPEQFGLVIFDEAHKLNNGESGQGMAGKNICRAVRRVLYLTGTPSDGLSSKAWDMAWNLNQARMVELGFRYKKKGEFIRQYGVLEEIKAVPVKDGQVTKGKVTHRVKEQPGIAGKLMTEVVLRTAVFGQLTEFFPNLPSYTEEVRLLPMSVEMAAQYEQFSDDLREEVRASLRNGSKRKLWMLMMPLMDCCENAFQGRHVYDDGDWVASFKPIGNAIQPKERDLIEFVRESIAEKQQVVVYAENTDTIDVTARLQNILESTLGIRVKRLVGVDNTQTRGARIQKWMEHERFDVMIVNPKRVEVGMSLPWATRVYFYQLSLSTPILRQAAQRGRGEYQRVPVKVVFALYDGTMQTKQLLRQAKKLKHAQLFDGIMPSGLAEADFETDSLLEALAKDLVGEGESVVGDVRQEWASLRELEVMNEEKTRTGLVPVVVDVPAEPMQILAVTQQIGVQELTTQFVEFVVSVMADDAPVGKQCDLFGLTRQVKITVKSAVRKKSNVAQLSLFG